MRRVLVTGMSGTGKSTALVELARRGFRVVDTDEPGWNVWARRGTGLAGGPDVGAPGDRRPADAVRSGCVSNQGSFYDRFDAVVLLSAPAEVILDRIERRTTNDYGKTPGERQLVIDHLDWVEPRLRATCTHEIDATRPIGDVVEALVAVGLADDD